MARDLQRRITRGVGLVLVTVLGAGCADIAMSPSATVTTTMPGVTERWFKLDWTVAPDRGDQRKLDGHVENHSGRPVTAVQLLIQALDTSGNLVDQRRQWLGGDLPNGARQFFAARHLPAAEEYRVSVWSYSAVEVSGVADVR